MDTSNFVCRDLVFRARDEDTSGNSDSPARTGFIFICYLILSFALERNTRQETATRLRELVVGFFIVDFLVDRRFLFFLAKLIIIRRWRASGLLSKDTAIKCPGVVCY